MGWPKVAQRSPPALEPAFPAGASACRRPCFWRAAHSSKGYPSAPQTQGIPNAGTGYISHPSSASGGHS